MLFLAVKTSGQLTQEWIDTKVAEESVMMENMAHLIFDADACWMILSRSSGPLARHRGRDSVRGNLSRALVLSLYW